MTTASNSPILTPCRLSPSQLGLLRPGLGRIFAAFCHYKQTGSSPYSYPFLLLPNAALKQGRVDGALMDDVLGLWRILYPKFGHRPRLHLSYVQISVAILAVRIANDEIRHKKAEPWKKRQEKEASLLLARLECLRLRAKRRLIADAGRAPYNELSSRWRELIRWIRMHIVYFRPWPRISLNGNLRRLIIDEAVRAAEKKIEFLELELPPAKVLRESVRSFLRHVRRGRAAGKVRDFANPHSGTVFTMVEFIRKRNSLQRRSNPTPATEKAMSSNAKSHSPSQQPELSVRPISQVTTIVAEATIAAQTKPFTEVEMGLLRESWKILSSEQRLEVIKTWVDAGLSRRKLAKEIGCSEGLIRLLLRRPKAVSELIAPASVPSTPLLTRPQLDPVILLPVQDVPQPTVVPFSNRIPLASTSSLSAASPSGLSVAEGTKRFLAWLREVREGGIGTYAHQFFSEVDMKLYAKKYHHALNPKVHRFPEMPIQESEPDISFKRCRPGGVPDDTSWIDYHTTWAVEWLLKVIHSWEDRDAMVAAAREQAITPSIALMSM
jgi:hypothetical protein